MENNSNIGAVEIDEMQSIPIWKNLSLDDMSGETWVPLIYDGISYSGYYDVSNFGRIKGLLRKITVMRGSVPYIRTERERILKQQIDHSGYLFVNTQVDGKGNKKIIKLHRAIGMTYHENPNNLPEVHHVDHIKTNNNVENLEWSTHADNSGKEKGRHSRTINPNRRLAKKPEKLIFPTRTFTKEQLSTEEWRHIKGFEELYKVSNLGRVWSIYRWVISKSGVKIFMTGRILKGVVQNNGYLMARLYKDGQEPQTWKISRLVAIAFIENPLDLPVVHHINHIRNDDRVENLMWFTYLRNNQEPWENGRVCVTKGEDGSMAKLTELQVLDIRGRVEKGESKNRLAEEYGVNRTTIRNIVKRKLWAHI